MYLILVYLVFAGTLDTPMKMLSDLHKRGTSYLENVRNIETFRTLKRSWTKSAEVVKRTEELSNYFDYEYMKGLWKEYGWMVFLAATIYILYYPGLLD